MEFVNKGSDYNCLKSLSKQGLVQKEVQVQGKHGTYIRKQWVSANGDKPAISQRELSEPHSKKSSRTLYFPISNSGNPTTKAYSYTDIMTYYSKTTRRKRTSRK